MSKEGRAYCGEIDILRGEMSLEALRFVCRDECISFDLAGFHPAWGRIRMSGTAAAGPSGYSAPALPVIADSLQRVVTTARFILASVEEDVETRACTIAGKLRIGASDHDLEACLDRVPVPLLGDAKAPRR